MPIIKITPDKVELPGFNLRDIISMLGNDYSQLVQIFCMFKEDFVPVFDKIILKLNNNEFYEAERLLHQLKGVAGNIGAETLYTISEELDSQLKTDSFKQETLDQWKIVFADTMQVVEGYISNNS